jgi:hypothetical protein
VPKPIPRGSSFGTPGLAGAFKDLARAVVGDPVAPGQRVSINRNERAALADVVGDDDSDERRKRQSSDHRN